jgi:hypothetical protein
MSIEKAMQFLRVVFALAIMASGATFPAHAQTETILHNFSGAGGEYPSAGLLLDPAGNLYGTTFAGGNPNDCQPYGCGVAYQLSHSSGSW